MNRRGQGLLRWMQIALAPWCISVVAAPLASCDPHGTGGGQGGAGGMGGSAASAGGAGGTSTVTASTGGGMGGAGGTSGAGGSGGGASGGSIVWSKVFPFQPDSGDFVAPFSSIAVDPSGGIALGGGRSNGTVDFGNGSVFISGNGFLARLDAMGNHLWNTPLGGAYQDGTAPEDLAVNAVGDLVSAGGCNANQQESHEYISYHGSATWPNRIGGATPVTPKGIGLDDAGNFINLVYAPGPPSYPPLYIGGNPLSGLVLIKGDVAGKYVWSKSIAANDNWKLSGQGIAVDGAGNSVVFSNSMSKLERYDASGNLLWSKPFPIGSVRRAELAADGSGGVLIALSFSGTIDLGGGPLGAVGAYDLAVARLDAQGNHVWSKRFGGPGFDLQFAYVSSGGAGGLVVSGMPFSGQIDLGAGPVSGNSFLLKLDAGGALQWSKVMTLGPQLSGLSDWFRAAVDPSSGAVIVAGVDKNVDFGSGPLLANVNKGIFVVKLAP